MNKILLILFLFISIGCLGKTKQYVRLSNYSNYTKYVKIKYQTDIGEYIEEELIIEANDERIITIYGDYFFIYSTSYTGRTVILSGNDDIGTMELLNNKKIGYLKIKYYFATYNKLKTIHIGI